MYVEAGQLWSLGSHRLLVGDAADASAVMQLTDDQVVDLLWTDPPYGVGYVGKGRAALTIANDSLGADETRDLLTAALRLGPLRPGGAFYVMAPSGPLHLEFLLALRAADLTLRQTLVWLKDRLNPGRSDYQPMHEAILYGWRAGAPHYFVGGRTQSSIWEIPRPGKSALHPTMKPSELVARAIRNSTRPGERVYDPFLGSGTTLIAAEMTGRVALGMEIDPIYAQVAIDRWQRFTGRKAERAPERPVTTSAHVLAPPHGRASRSGRAPAVAPPGRGGSIVGGPDR
jgi:DNA modification methylase